MRELKNKIVRKNKLVILTSAYFFLSAPLALAQENIPTVGKHVGANMDAMSMIVSLLLVLGLIVICALFVKRFQPMIQMNSGLKVVSSLSLGAKERLVVVQVGEKQLLLGVTSQKISLLDNLELPIKTENSSESDINKSLLSLFKKK